MINAAIASYGMSGEVFHAPLLQAHSGFRLHSILERTHEKSRGRYPQVKIVRSYDELLADPEIQLVVVNTPNPLHFPMTRDALLAGKHVVVEKPFTIETRDGESLIALAQEKKRVLSVFHNKKYEGEFKTVQKLIQENAFGAITVFETRFDRYRPDIGPKKWKEEQNPGAGILYDLGPHIIDQVLTLFGMPVAIEADIQIQRVNGQVPDYFRIELFYPTHTAVVSAGMLAKEPFLKYYITGENGTYTKYGNDPQEEMLKNGISPLIDNWGVEPESNWGTFETPEGVKRKIPTLRGSYMDYYTNVFNQIQDPADDYTSGARAALSVILIIELATQSSKEKRRVDL